MPAEGLELVAPTPRTALGVLVTVPPDYQRAVNESILGVSHPRSGLLTVWSGERRRNITACPHAIFSSATSCQSRLAIPSGQLLLGGTVRNLSNAFSSSR